MSATAAVVENRMEPVTKAEPTQQLVVTGQYLYDQFLVAGEEQKTRMAIIRDLVAKADAMQIKGACDSMVKIAHQKDIAAGVPEKEKGPKRNTAMNVRTFFQLIWGAMKHAPEQLTAMGYSEETGWIEARNMAKPALERAGKTWQGYDIPTDIQREQKALAKQRAQESNAYAQAMKDNPRQLNESDQDWFARVSAQQQAAIKEAKEEALNKEVESAVERLIKKHDNIALAMIAERLLELVRDSASGQSEISEEEAAALMAAAEAGNIEVHEEQPA